MGIPDQIVASASRIGVDPALALAVAQRESGFNQNARGSSGEIGIFQLMPETAAQLGVDPYNTQQNIDGGILYLGQMLGRFGDTALALAAYNWGASRVESAIAQYGSAWLAAAPSSVQGYVQGVLAAAGYGQPQLPAVAPQIETPAGGTYVSTLPPPTPSLDIGTVLLYGALAVFGFFAVRSVVGSS
jgi:soluble lytic murein transglycosylase-like protein